MNTSTETRTGRESACFQKHVQPHSYPGSTSTEWPQDAHRHPYAARDSYRSKGSVLFYKRIIALRPSTCSVVNLS